MKRINVMEIVGKLGAEIHGSKETFFDAVSIDTRKISENTLYIGFKGDRVDGNELYGEAFSNGASVCIVENVPIGEVPEGKTLLKVSSTYRAILDLAFYYRQMLHVQVIGITGSTGKTSTKDILHAMLSTRYKVFKTSGNFNNEIGLPLMIFSLDDTYDFAILEMGMSAPLEIHNLARVAQPDIAIITNIGISHIEYLGSSENILKAKMEITDFFTEKSLLVLNGDDEYLSSIREKRYEIARGGIQRGDYLAKNISIRKESVSFTVNNAKEHISLDVPGKHNVQNGILAYIVAKKLGITDQDLQDVRVEKSSMRMDLIDLKHLTVINDCYNANPDSMKSALDYLSTYSGRKVAILGTMKELGEEALDSHRKVAFYAKDRGIDLVVVVGEYMKDMVEAYGEGSIVGFRTFEEASSRLSTYLEKDDTVLIKASRGMYFERFIPLLEEFGGK